MSSAYLEVGSNLMDSLPLEAIRVFQVGKRIAKKNKFYIDETIYDRRIGITYRVNLKDFKKSLSIPLIHLGIWRFPEAKKLLLTIQP